jgi:hypothetical protein
MMASLAQQKMPKACSNYLSSHQGAAMLVAFLISRLTNHLKSL